MVWPIAAVVPRQALFGAGEAQARSPERSDHSFVAHIGGPSREDASFLQANIRRKYCLLFLRLDANLPFAVFNRCVMYSTSTLAISCPEHARLESEFVEARGR